MGLIIGQGIKSGGGGGGGDVRLETNHSATIQENGTHVLTPQEGYDGMRKATIKVDVESEGTAADKALAQATTLDGRLYNLWEVLPQVKADPRVSGYACIMLAEYWKGYNSLLLKGANAFLTCEGDFYQMSSTTDEVTHHWHDGNTMKDRWVAFLYTMPKTNYTPTSAEIMPRNILVDGHLGKIYTEKVVSRIQNYWTTEGSSIAELVNYHATRTDINGDIYIGVVDDFTETKDFYCVIPPIGSSIRNIVCKIKKGTTLYSADGRKGNFFYTSTNTYNSISNIELPILERFNGCFFCFFNLGFSNLESVRADSIVHLGKLFHIQTTSPVLAKIKRIEMPMLTSLTYFCYAPYSTSTTLFSNLIHFEIGQGFYSDLNLQRCTFANCLLTDSNDLVEDVVAHPSWSNLDQWLYNFEHLIVDKLADLSGQTAKTITLAEAPYAAITSEIRSKMSAKNWNLASA